MSEAAERRWVSSTCPSCGDDVADVAFVIHGAFPCPSCPATLAVEEREGGLEIVEVSAGCW